MVYPLPLEGVHNFVTGKSPLTKGRRGLDGRLAVEVMKATGSGARRSKREDPSGVRRGRPGRRRVDDRKEAELPLGKSTGDQEAFRFGVHPQDGGQVA